VNVTLELLADESWGAEVKTSIEAGEMVAVEVPVPPLGAVTPGLPPPPPQALRRAAMTSPPANFMNRVML
jgi:hypothetical protein